jgi:ribonuclease HII
VIEPSLEAERDLVAPGGVVIGMDEVGRGAIAGPVAVGAFALRIEDGVECPTGLRDSKLMTPPRREAMGDHLSTWGAARAVGLATAQEVDSLGIVAALGIAGRRALVALHEAGIGILASTVLLDGSHDWLSPQLVNRPRIVVRVKADRDCGSVAAASVVAKVHRDRLMVGLAGTHPEYGWEANKGYGSAAHFAAIAATGPSPHHRLTWLHRPLRHGLD